MSVMLQFIILQFFRLDFACEKEKELYSSLMDIADRKQGEIRLIIKTTVEDLRPVLLEKAAAYEFIGMRTLIILQCKRGIDCAEPCSHIL